MTGKRRIEMVVRRALLIAAVSMLPLQAAAPALPENGRAALSAFLRQSVARGDGGLFSTARDYGRFMQLFLNGGRIPGGAGTRLVNDESIRLMTTNQIGSTRVVEQPAAAPLTTRPFPIGAGKDTFGMGFQIETTPAESGMRSAGSYSWGGINNTHFWIDPQKGIAVAVLMQVLPFYDERNLAVLRGFERLLYRQLR